MADATTLVIIGGLGCSGKYMRGLTSALLGICPDLYVVYHPLLHGLRLEEEAESILRRHAGSGSGGIVLLGFSTGCTLVAYLAEHPDLAGRVRRVILVGPACLQSIIDERTRRWILASSPAKPEPKYDASWLPIMRARFGAWGAWWRWARTAGWYWALAGLNYFGVPPGLVARQYYRWVGRGAGDPPPSELSRTFFRLHPADLRKTVDQCLLRVDLSQWIRTAKRTVHIWVGAEDPYGTYARHLFDVFGLHHVRLHRSEGNHHFLFHRPTEAARRLAAIMKI